MWGLLSTTCSNVLKQPTWELLVAVNHNQRRTMASETVDPIDWSHPSPSWAVRLVHSMNQCNLSRNRTCNRSMRGNHLAYAATQGISRKIFRKDQVNWYTVRYNAGSPLNTLSGRIGKVVASHAEACNVARSNPGCC